MALDVIELADDWARRDLNIVVRSLDGLRPYARALADALRG